MIYMWQAVEHPEVRRTAKAAMWESARALMRRYPGEFTEEDQEAHIEDLLTRFANRALGDTIFRVGRDLPRKLSREDRLVGALLLDAEEGVPAPATTLALAAGFFFRAIDEHGQPFPADARFAEELQIHGLDWALTHTCGLRRTCPRKRACVRSRAGYDYLRPR